MDLAVLRLFRQVANGATVTETAHRCGWSTTSSFIDTFQRSMGRAPGAYRVASSVSADYLPRSNLR